jgi:hypothetical protein
MTNLDKWNWQMNYCKQNGYPPAQKWAWDKSEKAFTKEHPMEYAILKNGRTGSYITGREYDFPQVLEWEIRDDKIFVRDDSRKMGLMSIKISDMVIICIGEPTDYELGKEILNVYDIGKYQWEAK